MSLLADYDTFDWELRDAQRIDRANAGTMHTNKTHRPITEIIADCITCCRRGIALYERDEYRSAMWQRRLYLYEHDRYNEIWDGTDPVLWLKAFRAGTVGHLPSK